MRNFFVLVFVFASLLLVVTWFNRPVAPAPLPDSPEDAQARRIMLMCAIGGNESSKTAFSIALAMRLKELKTQANIDADRVGAIVDKITSDGSGVAIYKQYRECLREQAVLLLRQDSTNDEPLSSQQKAPLSEPEKRAVKSEQDRNPNVTRPVNCGDNQTNGDNSPIICEARDVIIKGN